MPNANTDEEYDLPTLPSIVLPTPLRHHFCFPRRTSKGVHPNRSAYARGTGGQNLLQQWIMMNFLAYDMIQETSTTVCL